MKNLNNIETNLVAGGAGEPKDYRYCDVVDISKDNKVIGRLSYVNELEPATINAAHNALVGTILSPGSQSSSYSLDLTKTAAGRDGTTTVTKPQFRLDCYNYTY